MKTVIKSIFFIIAMTFSSVACAAEEPESPVVPPHIVLMVSDDHYQADTLLPPLMEELARKNRWRLTVLNGKGKADFPDLMTLESVDTLVIFVRRLPLPEKQLESLKKLIDSGTNVFGMRTASHAFELRGEAPEGHKNWTEFDKEVLGGSYHNHGRDELGTQVENLETMAESGILRGVLPVKWHSTGSLYFTDPVAPNATIYQIGHSPEKQNIPLTWTRIHKKSRVAYTGLGHPDDYKEQAFRQLVENLIRWTLDGKDAK